MKARGIRNRLAKVYAGTHLKYAREDSEINFGKVLLGEDPILVLMPREAGAFEAARPVLPYLYYFTRSQAVGRPRPIHVFMHEIYRNWIDSRLMSDVLCWSDDDHNMLKLPNNRLVNRVAELGCGVALDLNLEEDLGASYVCGITGAGVRMAIGDKADQRYYNMRINLPPSEDDRLLYMALARHLHRAFFYACGDFPEDPSML